ncbi:MAG: serine/threonine-protein kinase [Pirellulaceae bacterium]|nr:serine/threonine-protein kinase [Pirellulaceae bacterium]
MPRSRIGPLALESPLGRSNSSVYRALHVQQRTQVAVRVFATPMGLTPEAKQSFAEQTEELKSLKHPGIVRCFGGGFDARDAYLVYELVDGESLDRILERRSRLPWEAVLDYGVQLSNALQSAHERGWVHGRIRPDKLIASLDEKTIKLSDFRRETSISNIQPEAITVENIAYTAAEALGAKVTPEPAVDIYSLGAVMYQALTGTLPFSGETAKEVRNHILESPVPAVATLVFDCPVWLSAIVEQMLDKDPNKRPFTAAAVAMALKAAHENALSGVGVAQHAVSGFSPLQLNTDRQAAAKALGLSPKRNRPAKSENPTPFTDRPWVLVLGIVLAIGAIYLFTRPLSEEALRKRAGNLMAKAQPEAYEQARDLYLLQLVARFPDGPHATWAREQLDIVDMDSAERKMERNRRFNRDAASEGERKYEEAQQFKRFGDRVAAMERYQAIIDLMQDIEKERAFVNLSRRQIARLKIDPPSIEEAQKLLSKKLEDADAQYRKGDVVSPKKTWESIVTLYNGNQSMSEYVEQAQSRLDQMRK